MSWWRRLGIVGSCGLIVLGGVILVVHFVQARQPGQAASGSVTLSQAQQIEEQLQQALALNNDGNTKGALELYDKVLSEDPSNPAALAYAGYLQWNVGSASHVASLVRIGRSEIETAVRDSPSYDQAHLFYGLVLRTRTTTTRQRWPSSTTSWPAARRRPSWPRWSPSSPAPTRRPGCPCRRSSRAASTTTTTSSP